MLNSGFFDKIVGALEPRNRGGIEAFIKRMEKERVLLETIFNTVREGIIVLDGKGKVKYVNQAAVELLGLPDDVEGGTIKRYMKEVDWNSLVGENGSWKRTSRREIEILYPERRVLLIYVVPLDPERGDAAVILSDVTETKNRSMETIESEKLKAISLLAAGVAHEIGNPLNSLNIHLQLLERALTQDRDEAMELLEIAKEEVARLDQVTAQFLQAVRSTKPTMMECDIKPLVVETLKLMKTEIEERDIDLKCIWPEHMPTVNGDPTQLKQAFLNLIKNALQATPNGGEIKIASSYDNENVSLSFKDSGLGIPKEDIGKLLTPYFTTKKQGTGLGLMVVERIVREHGGQIMIDSEEGQGANFTLLFPRASKRIRLLQPPPEKTPH
jgi:PAS domain S-box-containing protein